MADNNTDVKHDDTGAMGERLKARRALNTSGVSEPNDSESIKVESTNPKPVSGASEPDATDTTGDRLMARRAQPPESADRSGGEGEGEGEGDGEGSLGKQIAREPLFVGLGIRGHHRAGQNDSDAPPVKPTQASERGYEDLGAPDPQPTRNRKHRM